MNTVNPPKYPVIGHTRVLILYNFIADDWKADQYRWFQNGSKKLPTSNPLVKKVYFVNVTPKGHNPLFKRITYQLIDDKTKRFLIHYTGDHTTAAQYPHGNCKNEDVRPYVRTCPSVLKAEGDAQDTPANAYKKLVSKSDCASIHQPVLIPRDLKQVKNTQMRKRQAFRLTHDSLYNLHEVAYDLENYVSKITTYPDLTIVCGLKMLKEQLDHLILAKPESAILMSYDTTFQLGDFYVSAFLFKYVLFQSSPVIPVAFLIHERKLQSCHDELMSHLKKEIPSLSKVDTCLPIVVDDEAAFCKAIDENLPGVTRVRCWNHTINAAKLWLRRHGAASDEIPAYISYLRDLFHQTSEDSYKQRLEELQTEWSRAFLDYYYESIHPEVSIYSPKTHS